MLRNQEYETLHLADYKIYDYGQDSLDDQFKGSHSESLCCGHSGHWLARLLAQYQWLGPQFFGPPIRCGDRSVSWKKLYFIFQGSAPTQEVLEMGDYTMCRYAGLYGMDYLGMVNS